MRILDVRFQCSDHLFAVIDGIRCGMSMDDFMMHALQVGLGHLQEEMLTQQRQRTYEILGMTTENYHKALELQKLAPVPPNAPVSVSVSAFAQDMTRPKVAS